MGKMRLTSKYGCNSNSRNVHEGASLLMRPTAPHMHPHRGSSRNVRKEIDWATAATLLATFTRARDALEYLSSPSGSTVDIAFLDIEMPDLDGLTLLDTFKQRHFDVIFTTAHSEYAIEAIRKDAFDYLMKPVDGEELRIALERLAARRSNSEADKQLAPSEIPSFCNDDSRIRFEVDRKIVFLEPDDIIYCKGDGNYCHIHLEQGTPLFLTQQLKAVELLLPPEQFLRAHKSYIVNLSKIKEYHRVEHYLLLSNGKHIPVSKQMWGYFIHR